MRFEIHIVFATGRAADPEPYEDEPAELSPAIGFVWEPHETVVMEEDRRLTRRGRRGKVKP